MGPARRRVAAAPAAPRRAARAGRVSVAWEGGKRVKGVFRFLSCAARDSHCLSAREGESARERERETCERALCVLPRARADARGGEKKIRPRHPTRELGHARCFPSARSLALLSSQNRNTRTHPRVERRLSQRGQLIHRPLVDRHGQLEGGVQAALRVGRGERGPGGAPPPAAGAGGEARGRARGAARQRLARGGGRRPRRPAGATRGRGGQGGRSHGGGRGKKKRERQRLGREKRVSSMKKKKKEKKKLTPSSSLSPYITPTAAATSPAPCLPHQTLGRESLCSRRRRR